MSFITLVVSAAFTVTDPGTGQPVQNALCTVYAGVDFLGEGAYVYTNASGFGFVYLGSSIRSWRVTKTGYTPAQGTYPEYEISVSLISAALVYPVNVSAGWGTGAGTATATLNGVTVNTGNIIYVPANGSLVVTAHPASGSTFQKWRVNDVDQGNANPQTFIITGAADIEVWFAANPSYGQVNASVSPTGSGSVALNPSGGNYVYGTVVTAAGIASGGYALDHWLLDGVSYGPGYLQFTVAKSTYTLQAVFIAGGNIFTLATSVSPVGGGTVNPSGTSNQTAGSNVTLAATPASGYTFAGWGGDLTGTANPTTINMSGNKNVVANFTGGGTYKTQQVSFFANHLLSIPVSWMGNNVEVKKSYKFDEAKTTIVSATLRISAVNGGLSDAVVLSTIFNLSEVSSLVWNTAELSVTKTSDVDVTPFLINGDNTLKFDLTRASALQIITKDVWITAILLIEYEGDAPTVNDKTPVDWEKYLPWILGGGAVLVGLTLLTRGGGGGGGQGVTLNIREPARRVYQSVRKRAKK